MKWYRVYKYSCDFEEVEVVKETNKTVSFKGCNTGKIYTGLKDSKSEAFVKGLGAALRLKVELLAAKKDRLKAKYDKCEADYFEAAAELGAYETRIENNGNPVSKAKN